MSSSSDNTSETTKTADSGVQMEVNTLTKTETGNKADFVADGINTIPIEDIDALSDDSLENDNDDIGKISSIVYCIGVGYVLLAAICLSFQSNWVKFGKKAGYRPFQLLLTRGIIQMCCTGLIDVYDNCLCINSKSNINPNTVVTKTHHPKPKNLNPQNKLDWFYVVIRGGLGFGTAYCNYYGLTLLPLGDGAAIFATFPIWAVIFAAIFLRERIRWFHMIALVFGMTGLVFITQPPMFFGNVQTSDYSYKGVFLCLSGSFINGFAFLVLRKIKHLKATYSVYAYGIGAITGSLLMGIAIEPKGWKSINFSSYYEPCLLLTLGIFGFSGQYLKTKGIQYIPAGIASLVRCIDPLLGYILQVIFWKRVPTTLTIIGAICVVLPVIIISCAKLKKSKIQQTQQLLKKV